MIFFVPTLGEAVRALRRERRWTQAKLAEELAAHGVNLHPVNVGRREKDDPVWSPSERRILAKVFGISDSEFNSLWSSAGGIGKETYPVFEGIPIVSFSPAGDDADFSEYGAVTQIGAGFVDRGGGLGMPESRELQDEKAWALEVRGSGMAPTLLEGDTIILFPIANGRLTLRLREGSIVFVEFGDISDRAGTGTLARFRKLDEDRIVLTKDNPVFTPAVIRRDEISRLSVAIEQRRSL